MTRQAASPQISVVMPTYNRADTVSRAIDSILNQTCKDFELIIVNDGSTDGTQTILESYAQKDPRIKIVVQKNGGSARARNHGIQHAQCQYIAFMDDDDLSSPRRLESQLNCLTEEQGYSACVCATTVNGMIRRGEKKKVRMPFSVFENDKFTFPPFILDATTLIDKRVFEDCGGYNPHFITTEDTDFTIRFFRKYSAVALKESYYIIGSHSNNGAGVSVNNKYLFLNFVYRVYAYVHFKYTIEYPEETKGKFLWEKLIAELSRMPLKARKQLLKKLYRKRQARIKKHVSNDHLMPASYIFFLFFMSQFRTYESFIEFYILKFYFLSYFLRKQDVKTFFSIFSISYFDNPKRARKILMNGPLGEQKSSK